MKNKKWLLLLIIAFPSIFWLILETSTVNSKKLPYYGPQSINSKGDTVYFTMNERFKTTEGDKVLGREEFPLFAVVFLNSRNRDEGYRLAGLWEYLNYKKEKIQHIPFVLVTEDDEGNSVAEQELVRIAAHSNVHFVRWSRTSYDSLTKTYFRHKPYYVDYSFFVLVDPERHVRGYYDGRYVSEIKRLIGEYQHLRLKEEKEKLIRNNEIIQEH